jgi:hypothetical protein
VTIKKLRIIMESGGGNSNFLTNSISWLRKSVSDQEILGSAAAKHQPPLEVK